MKEEVGAFFPVEDQDQGGLAYAFAFNNGQSNTVVKNTIMYYSRTLGGRWCLVGERRAKQSKARKSKARKGRPARGYNSELNQVDGCIIKKMAPWLRVRLLLVLIPCGRGCCWDGVCVM